MLFKEKPWSILEKHPHILKNEPTCLYGVYVFDPFLERLYQSRMSQYVKDQLGMEHQVLLGKELTIKWIEENLLFTGLFSRNCCFLVLNSEEISEKVQDFILDSELNFTNMYLVFSFGKASKFFKNLYEKKEGIFYSVETVKFWESEKLLDFLSAELKVQLNGEVKKYLLTNIEQDSGSFINALKLIKLHFGDNIPSKNELSKLIPCNRLDFFQMANLLSKKQRKEFFTKLLDAEIENFNWHQFISFIIGHLIKLLDPSNLSPTGTTYEKEILNLSKLWTKEELIREISFFGDLQTEAKTRKNLKEKLRLSLLENS